MSITRAPFPLLAIHLCGATTAGGMLHERGTATAGGMIHLLNHRGLRLLLLVLLAVGLAVLVDVQLLPPFVWRG